MNTTERDQQTIRLMIGLYCRHHLHQQKPSAEYSDLAEYACQRLAHCRYNEHKPACKDCPVHCYKPEMRAKIRQVMRWTGPRMMFYSPYATLHHIIQCVMSRVRSRKNQKY